MGPLSRAGTPARKDRGGTRVPSSTTLPAPTRDSSPMTHPSRSTDPMPMRQRSSTRAPCRMTRCPTVTSSPTSTGGPPRVRCRMHASWMLLRRPMRIAPMSPRRTAPYHTDASSPSATSPSTVAVAATKAEAWMWGVWPRSAAMRGRLMGAGRLELLGIELAEVFRIEALEVAAQLLGALLGGALGLGGRDVLRDRFFEQLVHDEDR